MWLLVGLKEENKDQVFYIYQSREYTVSRKGGDVTLQNDQSISRFHAKIIHGTQEENQLLVMDSGSKYGTFLINDEEVKTKLSANEAVGLKSGSVIQFGLQWNLFRLEYRPLVVCPSTLGTADKAQLKEIVDTLNGQLVSDFQENTTHLTMNKITLTVKVVCALGYGKPIVNLEFWSALKTAAENNRQLPNYEEYTPPLVEKVLNKSKVSFKIDPERRTLFAGKTFITCCSAQKQRMENMVLAAGGKVLDWADCNLEKEQFLSPAFLVMKPAASDTEVADNYQQLMHYLKDHAIRTIAESEIGVSVVYCSTEKYCNPQFDFNSNLLKTEGSDQQSEASCLVPETLNATKEHKNSEQITIPESVPLLTPANRSRNRLIDNSDEDEPNPNREIKIEMDTTTRSEAPVDVSRDLFANTEDQRPSTSSRDSSVSSVSRKRPALTADEDLAVFDFGGRSKRNESTRVMTGMESEEIKSEPLSRDAGSVASIGKKPRLCLEDDEDIFNFPSDRKAAKRRTSVLQDEDSNSETSSKRRVSLLDAEPNSGTNKRRISLLDDEVDGGSGADAKRSRLDGVTERPPLTSWSQEMRKLDEQMKAVEFVSRQKPIKIEKPENGAEGVENDPYVEGFKNKAVIETKDLMPARKVKPVENPQQDEGPNFKKFKKNQVCRVNVTKMICKNNLRPFQLNENHDIWGNPIDEDQVAEFPGFEDVIMQAPIRGKGTAAKAPPARRGRSR